MQTVAKHLFGSRYCFWDGQVGPTTTFFKPAALPPKRSSTPYPQRGMNYKSSERILYPIIHARCYSLTALVQPKKEAHPKP